MRLADPARHHAFRMISVRYRITQTYMNLLTWDTRTTTHFRWVGRSKRGQSLSWLTIRSVKCLGLAIGTLIMAPVRAQLKTHSALTGTMGSWPTITLTS